MIDGISFIEYKNENVQTYMKEINKYNPLTREEEKYLSYQIQKNTKEKEESIEKLVCSNLKFGLTMAGRYIGKGVPLEDLISYANLGLIKAAKRFDGSLGYKFITYAVWYIKQQILTAINENGEIKIPNFQAIQNKRIDFFKENFYANNGKYPTPEEISKNLKLKEKIIENYKYSKKNIKPFNDNEKELIYNQIIFKGKTPEENLIEKEKIEKINEALEEILTKKEREIISMKFGFHGEPMTLQEIGEKYNLSGERIRQIKERALEKIRRNSNDLDLFL
jgi:RNA polymerase primary sigma factor|tara:strand:+ start:711 stop:1547 length:837 start_codon:yes stop_codon:yes gene_type:complete